MTDAQLILGLGFPMIAVIIGLTFSVVLVSRIRGEMRGLRADMREMRSEMREEFRGIRSDLSAISAILIDTNNRLNRLEGRM
jgi:hypothetical protein